MELDGKEKGGAAWRLWFLTFGLEELSRDVWQEVGWGPGDSVELEGENYPSGSMSLVWVWSLCPWVWSQHDRSSRGLLAGNQEKVGKQQSVLTILWRSLMAKDKTPLYLSSFLRIVVPHWLSELLLTQEKVRY